MGKSRMLSHHAIFAWELNLLACYCHPSTSSRPRVFFFTRWPVVFFRLHTVVSAYNAR
jgi:hypothetical protein